MAPGLISDLTAKYIAPPDSEMSTKKKGLLLKNVMFSPRPLDSFPHLLTKMFALLSEWEVKKSLGKVATL